MNKDTADYIRGIANSIAVAASLLIFNDMRSNVQKLSDSDQTKTASIARIDESLVSINKTLDYHTQKFRDIDSREHEEDQTHSSTALFFSPVKNYTAKELKYLHLAEEKIETTLRSQCATDLFAKRKLIQTNGRTGPEVLEHLRSLQGSVPVRMYYTNNRVLGYRTVESKTCKGDCPRTVHTNRKFHAGATACSRASNLAHEALGHVLGGYTHTINPNKSRPYSVPYSLNEMFRVCCKELK